VVPSRQPVALIGHLPCGESGHSCFVAPVDTTLRYATMFALLRPPSATRVSSRLGVWTTANDQKEAPQPLFGGAVLAVQSGGDLGNASL
jgi:hypothetical protein